MLIASGGLWFGRILHDEVTVSAIHAIFVRTMADYNVAAAEIVEWRGRSG